MGIHIVCEITSTFSGHSRISELPFDWASTILVGYRILFDQKVDSGIEPGSLTLLFDVLPTRPSLAHVSQVVVEI